MDIFHFIEFAFTVIVGWTLSALVLPRISLVSFRRRLFDSVDERKLHTAHIPRLGGIAFFPCITVTVSLVIIGYNLRVGYNILDMDLTNSLLSMLCCLFILYLIGMMDDLIGVRYRSKFVGQILCGILLPISGLYFDNLHGLFGIYTLPYYIGIPFTVFLIVYILNAINLIDGIDGLASGLSIISFLAFSCMFIRLQWWMYSFISLAAFSVLLTAAVCLGGYVPLQGQVSLTIEKAMDIAEEHSPSLRRSHMNLERYQQNLVAQRASLKSKFSLNLNPVDYSKSRSFDNRLSQWYTNERFSATGTFQVDQPILWTDGVLSLINRFGWQDNNSNIDGTKTSNKAFSNDLYLQLSQPIFTYNKRKMELQQIEYDYENANISYALQRLSTEKDITQQFYSVYMAQSQLAITREELTNAQQSYEIIKNKVEADLAARDELFQAEVNLASARSSLEEQQVSLENSKDQLKQTLGMDLNEDIMVFAEVQIKPVEVNLEKAIQHGLESRLELRQREIESKELAFDMIKTKALNEFKGDIALSFGLIGDNRHLEKIYNNPTQNPRVAISFSVPIFDWGEKKARVKAQEVAQKINRLEFHEDKVNIELNIRQTWRSLENLLSQIKIAKQNVANAQRTYDLNLTRYREGDITGMDMNQFQTQLSNKKIAYTQALINYKIELLNLKILSLYDFEHDVPIVPMEDLVTKK